MKSMFLKSKKKNFITLARVLIWCELVFSNKYKYELGFSKNYNN